MKRDLRMLENMMPVYPSVKDPKFAEKIFTKKEYADLMLQVTEETPSKPGDLYKIQKLVQRLISPHTPYDKLLVHAEPGVGKSCMISTIVENFKDIFVNGVKRRPALIIVPNDKLAMNMMREIADTCTDDLYKASLSARNIKKGQFELTENMEKRQFRKIFEKTYKVVTHEKFFMGKKSNYKQYDLYSNRIICIDEVHKIREYSSEEGNLYDRVKEFLEGVVDSRILLFTGTFIWDSSDELASTLNLLLPKKEQIPLEGFKKAFFETKKGVLTLTSYAKETLKRVANYYIYVRAMEADIPKTDIGIQDPRLVEYFKVFPAVLSKYHSDILKKETKGKTVEEEEVGVPVDGAEVVEGGENQHHTLAYFTTCIFPKYTDGKISGHFSDVKKGYRYHVDNKSYTLKDENFVKTVKSNLGTVSSKYASVFSALDSFPTEKAVIYEEYVTNVGTTLLASIFKAKGYELVTEDSDLDSVLTSKKKRLMLISGQNGYTENGKKVKSGPVIKNVVKASKIFSDPKNRYGEYCRALLGSKMIILGYSFKDVRQFHIIEHHWNDPLMEQALSRGYRAGSFDNLPKEDRYYHIYRHFAVHPGKDFVPNTEDPVYPAGESFSLTSKTRDFRIYEVVQIKSVERALILGELNRVSPFCALTYARNVLSSDIDFSRKCNYKRCNYECEGITPYTVDKKVWEYKPKKVEEAGFLEHYSSEQISTKIKEIQDLLLKKYSVEVDSLPDRDLSLRAVKHMINSKFIIRDQRGFRNYLAYDEGKIFLTKSILSADISSSYYALDRIYSQKMDLEDLLETILLEKDYGRDYCSVLTGEEDILNFSEPVQILMVENLYTKLDKEQRDFVFEPLKKHIFKLKDGTLLHDMYLKDYGGSYNVMKKLVRGKGKFRIYDGKSWSFLRDPVREAQYEKEIKSAEPKSDYKLFGKVIGIYSSKDESFRIKTPYIPNGRKCHTLPIQDMARVYIDMGFPDIPNFEETGGKKKEDLIESILLLVKKTPEEFALKSYSQIQLSKLLYFLMLGNIKRDMCPLIYNAFVESNKLNYS